MKIVVTASYNLGDTVYLVTDPDQYERLVTGITIRQGSLTYLLSCKTEETPHFSIEISNCKNVLKATSN